MAKPKKSYDIFISYAREDSRLVDRLAEQLDRSGYHVFVDREELHGGEQWRLKIVEALSASHTMLLVISPDFAQSQMVTREMALAREAGVRILPIQRERAVLPPDKIFYVDGINYIDFSRDFDEGFKNLLAALHPPADTGKVLAGKARSAAKLGLLGAGGLVALALLALLCYGAYLLAEQYSQASSQASETLRSGSLAASSGLPAGPPQEPVSAQPVSQLADFLTAPPEIQQSVSAVLTAAASHESNAYAFQDTSLASAVFTGSALQNLQDSIAYWASQGLVRKPTFYPQNSRILAFRWLDSYTLEVGSCEVWSAIYQDADGWQVLAEDPQQVYAKLFTLSNSSGAWMITQVDYPPPPNFCS